LVGVVPEKCDPQICRKKSSKWKNCKKNLEENEKNFGEKIEKIDFHEENFLFFNFFFFFSPPEFGPNFFFFSEFFPNFFPIFFSNFFRIFPKFFPNFFF